MNSLEWSGGMERWSGLLEWSTGATGEVLEWVWPTLYVNFKHPHDPEASSDIKRVSGRNSSCGDVLATARDG